MKAVELNDATDQKNGVKQEQIVKESDQDGQRRKDSKEMNKKNFEYAWVSKVHDNGNNGRQPSTISKQENIIFMFAQFRKIMVKMVDTWLLILEAFSKKIKMAEEEAKRQTAGGRVEENVEFFAGHYWNGPLA